MNKRKQIRILRRAIVAAYHCVDIIGEIDPELRDKQYLIDVLEDHALAVIGFSLEIIEELESESKDHEVIDEGDAP